MKQYYQTIVQVTIFHEGELCIEDGYDLAHAIEGVSASGVMDFPIENKQVTMEQVLDYCHENDLDPERFGLEPDLTCCVCGKPAEGTENVCECVCPVCQTPTFDDVTIADHGCCYDCFQKRRSGYQKPQLSAGTRVLLNLGDNGQVWGIIKEVDEDQMPIDGPYHVYTLDEITAIGWFAYCDFEEVGGSGDEEIRL